MICIVFWLAVKVTLKQLVSENESRFLSNGVQVHYCPKAVLSVLTEHVFVFVRDHIQT